MTLEQVQEKADSFFEFPTEKRDHVTTTSAILFANECAISGRANGIAWAERFTAEQCCQLVADKLYNGCIIGVAAVIKEKFGLEI